MMPTRRQIVCDEDLRQSIGKENSAGRSFLKTPEILCPESTSTAVAIVEQPELRAYKLGKQKCSYNQVELVIKDLSGGKVSELRVSEAIETSVGNEVDEQLRESCLKFHVRFVNNTRIQLYIYVVYSSPYGTTRPDKHTVLYHWMPVTRSKCRKGCTGSVIRGLQRFGRMPRRGAAAVDGEDTWKEPRHLYIAIDEASTHVCPRHETSKFRLLVAAYDDKHKLLGTTVSSSIRVLANNDAPLGAASFKLHCHLKGVTGPSPLRSTRLQFNDHPISVQCRLPLQALPPNTSPSSSKTTPSEEIPKSESSPSTETVLALPSTRSERRETSNKQVMKTTFPKSSSFQVVAVRGEDQRKNPVYEDLHCDANDHVVAHVTDRVLEACSVKPVESIISLRTLAKILGTKRGVVAEIFSVLQSVGIVQQHQKEKFRWLGSSSVMFALTKLSKEVKQNARRKSMAQCAGYRFGPTTSLMQQPAFRQDQTVDNLTCNLSKRLIRLFLIDVTTPVTWDQAQTIFLDNHQEKDAEEYRSTGRILFEILRIFGTLHLVKRCISRRYSPSTTYQWLGAEAVINHLNCLSGSTVQSEVCSASHYLRSSKYPTTRKRRNFTSESNGNYQCDDACANNSNQRFQQLTVLVTPQKQLEDKNELTRRSKRKISDTNEDKSEPFSAVCQQMPARKKCSVPSSIPKRPRQTVSSSQVMLGVSSISQDDRNCAPETNKVQTLHQASIPVGRSREQVTCEAPEDSNIQSSLMSDEACGSCRPLFQPSNSRGCLSSAGTDQVPTETSKHNRPSATIIPNSSRDDLDLMSKTGLETRFESSNAITLDASLEAPSTQFGDDNLLISTSDQYGSAGPSVFQFPYKKRPYNWSSFLAVAAPRCFDQPLAMECVHPGFFLDVTEQNELPSFKPLFYLQQLLTPQQVEHVTAQNPAFLFHYVHFFRVLYHKLSAQATRQGATLDQVVVRPVAEHGAFEMPSHLYVKKTREQSSSPSSLSPPPTLHQLLIPLNFSQEGLWLKKDSKTHLDFDRTSCHSPISGHHVDNATADDQLSSDR